MGPEDNNNDQTNAATTTKETSPDSEGSTEQTNRTTTKETSPDSEGSTEQTNRTTTKEISPDSEATENTSKPSITSASQIIPTENWCTDENGAAIPCKEVTNAQNVVLTSNEGKARLLDVPETPLVYPKADVNGSIHPYVTWDQEKAKGSQPGPSGPDQWCTDGHGAAVPCKELQSTARLFGD